MVRPSWKLKIWDEELLALTKSFKKRHSIQDPYARYVQLQNRIQSYFKNEICRILNKLAKKKCRCFRSWATRFSSIWFIAKNEPFNRAHLSFGVTASGRENNLEFKWSVRVRHIQARNVHAVITCLEQCKSKSNLFEAFIYLHCNADVNAGRVINQRRSLISEFRFILKRHFKCH